MDNKKRLMFFLEDDSYYISLKLLLILDIFECSKKQFIDYRKLSILFEIVKNEKNFHFVKEQIDNDFPDIDSIKNDQIIELVCNAKLNIPSIKRILLFLDAKEFVRLVKNDKKSSMDIFLNESEFVNELYDNELFESDISIIKGIKQLIPNARSIKFTTLKKKLFGNNEVIKWDD